MCVCRTWFCWAAMVWIVLGDQLQWKMGWIGEMALQSVTLTLKLSLKMPYCGAARGLMWCCVKPCDVVWCSVMWCDALRCSLMPCDVVWCVVMPCEALWYSVMPCDASWYSVMPCDASWNSVMPCDTTVTSWDVMWYYVFPCYALRCLVTRFSAPYLPCGY